MTGIERLLRDYEIHYYTQGKNIGKNWIGICCPLCDDSAYHGGFNISKGYYNCWICGGVTNINIIMALLQIPYEKASELVNLYLHQTFADDSGDTSGKSGIVVRGRAKKTKLPAFTGLLDNSHIKYLTSRKFDPILLERLWKLRGTKNLGNYKFRIIAPIFLDHVLVSYVGRDISGKGRLRYKVCKTENEVVHHKHTLYGIDKVENREAVVVEGITDVWRMGPGSVATFGIQYTPQQVLMLNERLDKVFILYDKFPMEAQIKADNLAGELEGLGTSTEILVLEEGDPAEMSKKEAKKIMEEVLGWKEK